MAARIRSLRNGITPIDEASRDDLAIGDVMTVTSLDAATTYAWAIAFAPEGSTAAFSGSSSAVSPGTFIVDKEGPYLIRLVVDAALPTENSQWVRLRALTVFGQLSLVAAGERRDETGIIPVDVDVEGWANDQNFNLQTLKGFIKPFANSGRVLHVDVNSGTTGYGDYSSVQAAIDAAVATGATNANQWLVLVHPGTFNEDLTFKPFVHVLGWPAEQNGQTTRIRGTHGTTLTGVNDVAEVRGLVLTRTAVSGSAILTKTGSGTLRVMDSVVTSPGTGPAIQMSAGVLEVSRSTLTQSGAGATLRAIEIEGANSVTTISQTTITGPNGVRVNNTLDLGVTASLLDCVITANNAAGSGLSGQATLVSVTRTVFRGIGTAVLYGNPSAPTGFQAVLDMSFSTMATSAASLVFNTANLTTSVLRLGSVVYTTLSFPSGAPTIYEAKTQAKTHFYDNTVSGLLAENVQDAIDEIAGGGGGGGGSILEYHEDMPEAPNSTVRYRGWVPVTATLLAVRVYMQTVNTVGTYTLAVKNEATGNTVLSAATFNMNSLGAATVTSVPLTGVGPDKAFAALGRWTISLVSNNAGFNGVGVYVELQFGIGLTGAAGQDLATTLTFGNVTGGNDIILNTTDIIRGEQGVALAGSVLLRGGTATGGVANGGDIIFRPGAGLGGGTDGEVILRNAAGTNNIHLKVTAAQQISIGTTLPLVYNGVTGKLTVPGLIDPTGIIFERAGPPTTTATEGAVFVSDGTSGLTINHLYFRPLSNGTPVDLTTGGATPPLADVLVAGNTSDGTNIKLTTDGWIEGGEHGVRRNWQENVWGYGQIGISDEGYAQGVDAGWFGITPDDVPAALFLDNISLQYIVPDYCCIMFTCHVAMFEGGGTNAGGFVIHGMVRKAASAASVEILGQNLVASFANPALATASVTMVVDVGTGAVYPEVTGVAATDVRWTVRMTGVLTGYQD